MNCPLTQGLKVSLQTIITPLHKIKIVLCQVVILKEVLTLFVAGKRSVLMVQPDIDGNQSCPCSCVVLHE